MTTLTPAQRRRQRAGSLLLPKDGASAHVPEPCRLNPRLAIYVRLSLDTAASVSIARQRALLEEYVTELGGVYDPKVDYYADNDLSAKGTVYRPAAEELLRAVKAGRFDGVVVWEFARFMRTVRETHIACGLMREHAVELYSFEEPHLTLYGPARIALEFAADQAEKELRKISARVSSAKAFLAGHGAAPARAPFGTVKVPVPSPVPEREAPLNRLAPDETPRDELGGRSRADLVRQAAATIVAGGTLRGVAMAWNAAGYPSPYGSEWVALKVSRLMRNPVMAGYAVSRGQVVRGDDGQPVRFHTPVLDEQTWADLCAAMATRKGHPRSGNESPLRGLVRCGRCGAAMSRGTSNKGYATYRCSRRQHGGSCPGNTIGAAKTEAFVLEAARAVLADPQRLAELQGQPVPDPAPAAPGHDLERLRVALERLDRSLVLGEFDDPDGQRRYRKLKADLTAELRTATATAAPARRRGPRLVAGDGLSPAEVFDQASPAEQLTVLCELIEHVSVLPAAHVKRGPGSWDHARLSITWNEGQL